jgi:acetylornithine/succinyldiaminopimelate/putrescine aminotransferase
MGLISGRRVVADGAVGMLDLCSGGGAAVLGFQPRPVVRAVSGALRRTAHAPLQGRSDDERTLEHELRATLGLDDFRVFPATTGSEAVDLAIRVAHRVTGRRTMIYLRGAYHGATLAAMSVCGLPGWRRSEEAGWFDHVQLDIPAEGAAEPDGLCRMKAAAEATDGVAGVILEPMQSNRGFRIPAREALGWLREFCDRRGALLIVDEIGGGLGRCGFWLGIHRAGITPDVVVLGKNLGAGVVPIAATLVREKMAASAGGPGMRSSLAWSPPACSAALATLRTIRHARLVERAQNLGRVCEHELGPLRHAPLVECLVGAGLGWGIGLKETGEAGRRRLDVVRALAGRGVHVEPNPGLPGVRLMPALTIPKPLLRRAVQLVRDVIAETE